MQVQNAERYNRIKLTINQHLYVGENTLSDICSICFEWRGTGIVRFVSIDLDMFLVICPSCRRLLENEADMIIPAHVAISFLGLDQAPIIEVMTQ